jgi:trigger factor
VDALADELGVQVGQDDLTERLLATSRQYGIEPQQLFGYLQENNQLPAMFADVRRSLAIAAAVEAATVTDSDGNTIDTGEFFGKRGQAGDEEDSADIDDDIEDDDIEDDDIEDDDIEDDDDDETADDVVQEASEEAAK